jgi:hypothetical protein
MVRSTCVLAFAQSKAWAGDIPAKPKNKTA